jgi:hypothetical protein
MVTEAEIYSAALARYRQGSVLIWLGALTWLPFIILRIAGEKPSLFWFLPFHLIGVIGGARLRSLARKEIGALAPKKNLLRVIGHGLIYAGILVWLPYFYLKVLVRASVDVMDFLPHHLTGVFGGIMLLGISYLIAQKNDGKS